MANRTGRGKGRGARADRKTGDQNSPAFNNKDVPQFAPNFTVYLLPPDAVCLYSEHRKFFLHGELYCALAAAIGEGGWTCGELVRALEPHFPTDKIHEALTRLLDRGYLLPASRSSAGAVAAYWASLGLSPQAVQKSLQACRVRIQSIDVQGAKELAAALSRLGVRVVQALSRSDRHAGERLSRRTPGRTEPAASGGSHALAAGPALRHFSPGGTGVQPGRERLLDLSFRSHAAQPRDQGDARPQPGPLRCRFRRWPATRSDRTASSLQPSKSRRPSPPALPRN